MAPASPPTGTTLTPDAADLAARTAAHRVTGRATIIVPAFSECGRDRPARPRPFAAPYFMLRNASPKNRAISNLRSAAWPSQVTFSTSICRSPSFATACRSTRQPSARTSTYSSLTAFAMRIGPPKRTGGNSPPLGTRQPGRVQPPVRPMSPAAPDSDARARRHNHNHLKTQHLTPRRQFHRRFILCPPQ